MIVVVGGKIRVCMASEAGVPSYCRRNAIPVSGETSNEWLAAADEGRGIRRLSFALIFLSDAESHRRAPRPSLFIGLSMRFAIWWHETESRCESPYEHSPLPVSTHFRKEHGIRVRQALKVFRTQKEAMPFFYTSFCFLCDGPQSVQVYPSGMLSVLLNIFSLSLFCFHLHFILSLFLFLLEGFVCGCCDE